jgi:NAD(P)-dependent dehydrogenase (short-subunit alcohol dehydrogenase family)
MMGRSLEGRVALVTGASQGGTGTAVAVRFAAEGAKVAITARSDAGLQETLARIEDVGGTGVAFRADLSDPDGGRATLVERTVDALGPIDILVNNAAAAEMKPIGTFTLAELHRLQEVNVWAPWQLITQVLPGMRDRDEGWILNLTSACAELPPGPPFGHIERNDGFSAFSATKAALNRMTISAAAETQDQGIAVNALTPQFFIATPIVLSMDFEAQMGPGVDDVSVMFEPIDTMAEAALALCSGDPAVLTGRIAYSLQLLLELDRPVYDVTGRELLDGMQPADLEHQVRRQIEVQRQNGGPDFLALNRPSTPIPAMLRSQA